MEFPVGSWVHFESVYSLEDRIHHVTAGDIMWDKPEIPHNRIEKMRSNGNCLIKYEFKIDVELINKKKEILFNQTYGYISHSNNKFVARQGIKKYWVIVEEDNSPNSFSLFKLVRMAQSNEKMKSQQKGCDRVVDDVNMNNLFDGLGLESEEIVETTFEEKSSQVDFNSEYMIRERKLEATKRKRERKKKEKEEMERILREEFEVTNSDA